MLFIDTRLYQIDVATQSVTWYERCLNAPETQRFSDPDGFLALNCANGERLFLIGAGDYASPMHGQFCEEVLLVVDAE